MHTIAHYTAILCVSSICRICKKKAAQNGGFLKKNDQKTGKKEIILTQEEIAVEINTAREVIARMLKQFASDGLVELKRGKILLKEIDSLKIL